MDKKTRDELEGQAKELISNFDTRVEKVIDTRCSECQKIIGEMKIKFAKLSELFCENVSNVLKEKENNENSHGK